MKRFVFAPLLVLVWLVALACATPAAPPTATPEPAPTVTPAPTATVIPTGLYVDATAETSPINPFVYGTNYGPWTALTVDVMDEFEQSGLTFIRFPGGRWGDTRDIKSFDVDWLMTLADMIDAETTISARLLGGTPEQAADLVRMVNIEQERGVKYWSIGNEPSLYIDFQDALEWDTEYYNQQWRIFAEAMLEVDPGIVLLGPNIHQIAADPAERLKDPSGRDWLEEFLRANGDLVDVVTFHRYPFPASRSDPLPTFEMMRDNTAEWDEIIPAVRETIIEITGEDKPIGIGEINSNYTDVANQEYSPDGYYNAIWWGDILGRLINNEMDMVNHFVLSGTRAGLAMLGRTEARPIYYVYQLYQQFGDELLFSTSDESYVSVVASMRDDGAVTVMVTNRDAPEATVPLEIVGVDTTTASEVWRLEDGVWAENLGAMDVGSSITLPGKSMTLFVFGP